jgi:ATP-binding cassette subfamily A (ABC1) protein 3
MCTGALQMEEYEGLLTYCIANPTLTWSTMFGMMERAKHQLNIEDYSLGQTSLEQVSSFMKLSVLDLLSLI